MDYLFLKNKRIIITGATGLIGKSLVKKLNDVNQAYQFNLQILAVVRNETKAKKLFAEYSCVEYIVSDILELNAEDYRADYFIHAASMTSSKAFVEKPIETLETAIEGTKNALKLAKKNNVKAFVYLSSMEVYGAPQTDEKISETHSTNIDTMQVRSCYPESKRMCENICVSYGKEYGLPVRILRLTQTFGPGVEYNDGRVFAEFARCAIEGKDIILHTKGLTKRSYLYTEDCVKAILITLNNGHDFEAYNVANEETYCTIYDMAKLCAKLSGYPIKVKIEEEDISQHGYAPVLHMNLDTKKIQSIGWKPSFNLQEMFINLIDYMKK